MIFTLHDLTYFYIERVTAHRIKKKIIHVFITSGQTPKQKLKLKHFWARGPPGVSGTLRSLHILRISRIGSAGMAMGLTEADGGVVTGVSEARSVVTSSSRR